MQCLYMYYVHFLSMKKRKFLGVKLVLFASLLTNTKKGSGCVFVVHGILNNANDISD